jgi:hypothetical protein
MSGVDQCQNGDDVTHREIPGDGVKVRNAGYSDFGAIRLFCRLHGLGRV